MSFILLNQEGVSDVLVVGGGVIPEDDRLELEKAGALENFGPRTPLSTGIEYITSGVSKQRKI